MAWTGFGLRDGTCQASQCTDTGIADKYGDNDQPIVPMAWPGGLRSPSATRWTGSGRISNEDRKGGDRAGTRDVPYRTLRGPGSALPFVLRQAAQAEACIARPCGIFRSSKDSRVNQVSVEFIDGEVTPAKIAESQARTQKEIDAYGPCSRHRRMTSRPARPLSDDACYVGGANSAFRMNTF